MATVTTPRVNLATNPALEGTGAAVTIRTNLCTNPSFETGIGSMLAATVVTLGTTTFASSVYSGTQALSIGIGPGAGTFTYVYQVVNVAAGEWLSFASSVRWSSGSQYARQRIGFHDGAGAAIGTAVAGPVFQASSGTGGGSRVTMSGLAPTGTVTARVYLYFYNDAAGAVAPLDGSVLASDAWHAATGATQADSEWRVATYFDGSTTGTADISYSWSGTAHASTSNELGTLTPTLVATAPGVGGVAAVYRTSLDAPPGKPYAAKQLWTQGSTSGSAGTTYTTQQGGVTGDVVTAKIWVKFNVSRTIQLLVRPRNASTLVAVDSTIQVVVPANTWTEIEATVTATGDYTNVQVWPWFRSPSTAGAGDWIILGKVLIEKNRPATARTIYFDGGMVPESPPGYSPEATYSYSWTSVANASTSVETLSVPLQDYQIELPDDTIAGAGTTVGLLEVTGLRGSANVRSSDYERAGVDGTSAGMSFLGGRTIGVKWLLTTAGAIESALQILNRNWQNTNDPSNIVMTARDYLMQVAAGGSKLVSAIEFQLPGRSIPFLAFGKPGRLDPPVNSAYQVGWLEVTSEWLVPDGKIYDTVVNSATSTLPTSNGGATFPWTFPVNFGPSTGGTLQVANGGMYPAKPVFKVLGPVTNPIITDSVTGKFVRVNLSLVAGDVLVIDSDSRVVRLNGANRNIALDVGSSFFTIPPGGTSLSFSSTDSGTVSGSLSVYTLNTYSAA